MFIQKIIEDSAVKIISSSLVSGSVTGWEIHKGVENNSINFPCVKVICSTFSLLYPELGLGVGKAELSLISCGIKPNQQGIGITAATFQSVSDIIFNPFLANNVATSMSISGSLSVSQVIDGGLEVTSLDDGWIATQKLQVVAGRLS